MDSRKNEHGPLSLVTRTPWLFSLNRSRLISRLIGRSNPSWSNESKAILASAISHLVTSKKAVGYWAEEMNWFAQPLTPAPPPTLYDSFLS